MHVGEGFPLPSLGKILDSRHRFATPFPGIKLNGNISIGGNLVSTNSLTIIKQIKTVTFTEPKSVSFTDATNNVFVHIPEFDISLTTSDTNCERLLMFF